MENRKVLLFMPTIDGKIPVQMVNFLMNLDLTGIQLTFRTTSRLAVDAARNLAILGMVEGDFDYLLFLDDDNPPEHRDFIQKLLRHGKDVVAGVIRLRTDESKLSVYKGKIHEQTGLMRYENYTFIKKGLSLQEIENTGTGCVLLSRKLCNDMYQNYHTMPFESRAMEYYRTVAMQPTGMHFVEADLRNILEVEPDTSSGKVNTQRRHLSEDLLFFERARQIGYKLYFDPEVTCFHIGRPKVLQV